MVWQVVLTEIPLQLVAVPAQDDGAPGNQAHPLLGRQVADEVKSVQAVGLPVHTAESDQEHPETKRHTGRSERPGQPLGETMQVPIPGVHPQ